LRNVSPNITRAGTFFTTSSIPTARNSVCSTCSTSSRVRLPAVVTISTENRCPAGLTRMPSAPA
jgi:hypothetical protein